MIRHIFVLGELSVFTRHEIPVSEQNLILPFPRVIMHFIFSTSFGLYKVASLTVEQYQLLIALLRKNMKTCSIITFSYMAFYFVLYLNY